MNRVLWRSIVVGLLFLFSNSHQQAAAQTLREPTRDDRFGGAGGGAPKGEQSLLSRPQAKATRQDRETGDQPGPAYFGVTFDTENRGAVVRAVTPGSPAARAGLQATDIFESLQGQTVNSYQDVLDIVARMRPGDVLNLEFSRRMSIRTQAALASLPAATTHSVGYPADSEQELIPMPSNTRADVRTNNNLVNRSAVPQRESGSTSNQRRSYNQNGSQTDNSRGFLGRVGRRR